MPKETKIYSPEQRRFIEWLATPKPDRKPATQQLLSKELGVDNSTLSDWKRIEGFADKVAALANSYLKSDLPEIYSALAKQAKKGNVQAIKLALEVTGHYVQHIDHTTDGEKLPTPQIFLPQVNEHGEF